jgi:hypothetical protein
MRRAGTPGIGPLFAVTTLGPARPKSRQSRGRRPRRAIVIEDKTQRED